MSNALPVPAPSAEPAARDLLITYPCCAAPRLGRSACAHRAALLSRWLTQTELPSPAATSWSPSPAPAGTAGRDLRRPRRERAGHPVAAAPRLPRPRQVPRNPAGRSAAARPAPHPPRLERRWPSAARRPRICRYHTASYPDPPNALPRRRDLPELPRPGDRLAARSPADRSTTQPVRYPERAAVLPRPRPRHLMLRKSQYVVARRLAHNRYLSDAVHQSVLLQPQLQRLGPRLLRHQDRRLQESPQRPVRPRQLAGWRSSGTASPEASPTTRSSTPPTATAPSHAPPKQVFTLPPRGLPRVPVCCSRLLLDPAARTHVGILVVQRHRQRGA